MERGSCMVDFVIDVHRMRSPLDHPDRSVTREKLEYPTHGVSFAYLSCINQLMYCSCLTDGVLILTREVFADKAVLGFLQINDYALLVGRVQDRNNFYTARFVTSASAADFDMGKYVAGSWTRLAYDAVNLDTTGRGAALSITGTSLKAMRYEPSTPVDPLNMPSPARTLTATDTTFANGRWGYRNLRATSPHGGGHPDSIYVMNPMSPSPQPVAYYEVPVVGSGTEEDPYRAQMPEQVEMDWSVFPPARRKYEILRRRGFTDEEIELLCPEVRMCKVNRLALTHSSLIVTDGATGKPVEYTAIVRVFYDGEGGGRLYPFQQRLKRFESQPGVRRLSREEAIEKARRMDDKLHAADLVRVSRGDPGFRRKVREYVEWRLSLGVKPEQIDEQVVTRYVMEEKGW